MVFNHGECKELGVGYEAVSCYQMDEGSGDERLQEGSCAALRWFSSQLRYLPDVQLFYHRRPFFLFQKTFLAICRI